jgi:hypothetical protein
MAEPPPTYSREEMDAILKRAIERQQAKTDGIGHEELVEAAGEVGIPREEVEAAARDLAAEKARQPEAAATRAPVAMTDGRRREIRRFFRRAAGFGVLTLFFYFLSGGGMNGWWIWAAMGFGVSLAMNAIKIAFYDERDESDERDERGGLRRPSRRDRRRMRREEKLAEFERKVQIGADALVRVLDEARLAKSRVATPGVRVEARSDQRADEVPANAEAEEPRRESRRQSP